MKIEVVAIKGMSTTARGGLLETLACEILNSQSYDITQNMRLTATEIDLFCTHRLTKKTIYVECKAFRKNISANILTNLLGTVTLKKYQEGWLISTGDFSKDAKGFIKEWEDRS